VIRWGRGGSKFLGCPRYPECKNAMPMTEEGQPVQRSAPEKTDYQCPLCGGALIRKNGPFGPYVDCERWESEECSFRGSVPVGVPCPECTAYGPTHGELVEKKTRRGTFYGCWNYPKCSYTTKSLEPGKLSPVRPREERDAANKKLLERSERGKAAYAKRRANARARAAS
jgi:DNA topoisomerase I